MKRAGLLDKHKKNTHKNIFNVHTLHRSRIKKSSSHQKTLIIRKKRSSVSHFYYRMGYFQGFSSALNGVTEELG